MHLSDEETIGDRTMMLTATLRKVMTAALVLPAGVTATSSYADCGPAKDAIAPGAAAPTAIMLESAAKPTKIQTTVKGGRLSRTAFYGDEVAVSISEL